MMKKPLDPVTSAIKSGSGDVWKALENDNKKLLETHKAGHHNFVEIYRAGEPGHQDIIKWCTICGAVVIDHEDDPGGALKIMGPKVINLL